MKTVHVVGMGMGPADLTPAHIALVKGCGVLAGGTRLMGFFPDHPGERLALKSDVASWMDEVARAAEGERVAVLASGDPGFYGVAARLVQRLGPDSVAIHPNTTAVQAAFSRIKEPWNDAAVVSLHGRGLERLWPALQGSGRVAVLTDRHNNPARLAGELLARGQDGWQMWVLEDMGDPDEKAALYDLKDASAREFSALNLVVLKRTCAPRHIRLGAPEKDYEHQNGLITKAEVRAVALSRLELGPGLHVWDLGAGCGSVGLEAGLLTGGGPVTAVEKDPERVKQIEANRASLQAPWLEAVCGELPGALRGLADPDRVFIGGGGGALAEIIGISAGRMRPGGVMVASLVRMRGLDQAWRAMEGANLQADVVQVSVARGTPLAGDIQLKALNPVWLVRGRKAAEDD